MTSSYNISRRPPSTKPINWDAYFYNKQSCPQGFYTVPLDTGHDWKYCVPIKEDNNIKGALRNELNEQGYIHKQPKKFESNGQIRRFIGSNDFYDTNSPSQQYPFIWHPPEMRRFIDPKTLEPMRTELDKADYSRLPMNFDGTGMQGGTRSWVQKEYASDMYKEDCPINVGEPHCYDRHRLIQPNDVQQQTYEILKERRRNPYNTDLWEGAVTNMYKSMDQLKGKRN
jgi:hypothetical protein